MPYDITLPFFFAFADASHFGAVDTATVTMQWEVGQRMVAKTRTKVSTKKMVLIDIENVD